MGRDMRKSGSIRTGVEGRLAVGRPLVEVTEHHVVGSGGSSAPGADGQSEEVLMRKIVLSALFALGVGLAGATGAAAAPRAGINDAAKANALVERPVLVCHRTTVCRHTAVGRVCHKERVCHSR